MSLVQYFIDFLEVKSGPIEDEELVIIEDCSGEYPEMCGYYVTFNVKAKDVLVRYQMSSGAKDIDEEHFRAMLDNNTRDVVALPALQEGNSFTRVLVEYYGGVNAFLLAFGFVPMDMSSVDVDDDDMDLDMSEDSVEDVETDTVEDVETGDNIEENEEDTEHDYIGEAIEHVKSTTLFDDMLNVNTPATISEEESEVIVITEEIIHNSEQEEIPEVVENNVGLYESDEDDFRDLISECDPIEEVKNVVEEVPVQEEVSDDMKEVNEIVEEAPLQEDSVEEPIEEEVMVVQETLVVEEIQDETVVIEDTQEESDSHEDSISESFQQENLELEQEIEEASLGEEEINEQVESVEGDLEVTIKNEDIVEEDESDVLVFNKDKEQTLANLEIVSKAVEILPQVKKTLDGLMSEVYGKRADYLLEDRTLTEEEFKESIEFLKDKGPWLVNKTLLVSLYRLWKKGEIEVVYMILTEIFSYLEEVELDASIR